MKDGSQSEQMQGEDICTQEEDLLLVLIRAERTKVTVELHVYTWTGFGRSSSGGTSVSELSALSGESVVRAMVTKFEAGT